MPIGSGATPRFALFAEKTAAIADLLRRFEGLLDPDVRSPVRKDGIWLVRPDGYTACSTTDPGVIAGYLGGLLQPSAR
jgi:hypothetical protein